MGFGCYIPKLVSCCVTRTSNLSIPNGSETTITWTLERWDYDSMWASASPTRITLKSSGIYLIGANIVWAANATGERRLRIYPGNGGTQARDFRSIVGDAYEGQFIAFLDYVTAGRYYTVDVYQTSGGALSVLWGEGSPRFWAVKLSDLM